MVKKNFLSTLLFVSVVLSSNAQQDKIITHFIYDKMSINPGETGIDEGICGTSVYRNQWDKVSGAPNSAILNVEANINRFFPGGVGISFFHDAIGFVRQNNVLLNYAYPVHTRFGTLGIGAGAGLINVGMQPDWVPPTQVVDKSLPIGFSKSGLDLNFGLYWKGTGGYYAGISSTHLSATRLSQAFTVGSGPTALNGITTYSSARHYYAMGGYTYPIGPGKLDANVLIRTDFVKLSSDINVRYLMGNSTLKYYGGLTYRTSDALAVMVGGTMNNFTLGYSYDYTIGKLSSISQGTHEVLLKYCYYLPDPKKSPSKHPRWL
jgi:type IX secretion system PorP/SprF family membrane protein